MSDSRILSVRDLEVAYADGARALRGVSFDVAAGERIGIVGESGCGKTTLIRALLGLLPRGARVLGQAMTNEESLIGLAEPRMRKLRGSKFGYVPQNPLGAFDPLRSVGSQLAEAWSAHGWVASPRETGQRLSRAGIDEAETLQLRRPAAWSGGMLQRAAIVAATALMPDLVLADEPTSALDRPLARKMLAMLSEWSRAALIVTHDVDLLDGLVDRILVMYAGRIVEDGKMASFAAAPRHPYSRALLASLPQPSVLPAELPGNPPSPFEADAGCAFATRCERVTSVCATPPALRNGVACHHPREASL